jgi:hypothetical protein
MVLAVAVSLSLSRSASASASAAGPEARVEGVPEREARRLAALPAARLGGFAVLGAGVRIPGIWSGCRASGACCWFRCLRSARQAACPRVANTPAHPAAVVLAAAPAAAAPPASASVCAHCCAAERCQARWPRRARSAALVARGHPLLLMLDALVLSLPDDEGQLPAARQAWHRWPPLQARAPPCARDRSRAAAAAPQAAHAAGDSMCVSRRCSGGLLCAAVLILLWHASKASAASAS